MISNPFALSAAIACKYDYSITTVTVCLLVLKDDYIVPWSHLMVKFEVIPAQYFYNIILHLM